MITIVNMSALAPPIEDTSIPASLLNYIDPNLARQWLSIKAFAKLQTDYDPPSMISSILCCGMFGISTYSYFWVLKHINWSLISQYKIGELKTIQFLNHLLIAFPFLKTAEFTEEIKKSLFKDRENLISITELSRMEELTPESIALALLERAWLARMQFSEQTDKKIEYFFNHNKGPIYIIGNTNERDCIATIKYLCLTYPDLDWLSFQELYSALQVPNQEVNMGIPLTRDGRIKLYVSYIHRAFKIGSSNETLMTTDNLLKKLVAQEDIKLDETKLVSQWLADRDMARTLNFNEIIDSKIYFSPIESKEIKQKTN